MKIYGIDFTSAPTRRKPITLAVAVLHGGMLTIRGVQLLADFEALESWLRSSGPWWAGFDFPFGQPRRLIDDLGWPSTWSGYVSRVGQMSKAEFVDMLRVYRDGQPPGKKHHLRRTDRLAGAVSPMMLYGVPVGKMFFEGAPRLLRSGVSVLPCHPAGDDRVALEVYPALAIRRWIGRQGYKSDNRRKQTQAHRENRQKILQATGSEECCQMYGVAVRLGDEVRQACLDDASGDRLDAVLCTIPTAWAYSRMGAGNGIPANADPTEGWIVDPTLVE